MLGTHPAQPWTRNSPGRMPSTPHCPFRVHNCRQSTPCILYYQNLTRSNQLHTACIPSCLLQTHRCLCHMFDTRSDRWYLRSFPLNTPHNPHSLVDRRCARPGTAGMMRFLRWMSNCPRRTPDRPYFLWLARKSPFDTPHILTNQLYTYNSPRHTVDRQLC